MPDDRLKDFTVFYAWQSDRANNTNRAFIKKATETALKRISLPPELYSAPRMDQDTKGEPGTPDIANTILKKIENCDVFLADVTLINTRAEGNDLPAGRPTPNPNVLIELGYALASRGAGRVILVMNEHFGSFELLPFDLRHKKRPIWYSLSPAATTEEKKSERPRLGKLIEDAIRLIIESKNDNDGTTEPIVDMSWAEEVRADFHKRLSAGKVEELESSDGILAIGIIPSRKPGKRIDITAVEPFLSERLKPISAGGWNPRRGARYFGTVARDPSTRKPVDVTEFTDENILLAANGWLVREHSLTEKVTGRYPAGTWGVYPARIEGATIKAVHKYLSVLQDLHVSLPWFISVALLDLGPTVACSWDLHLHLMGDVVFKDINIIPELVQVNGSDDFADENQVACLLRPAMNYLWRAFGFSGSPYYDREGNWIE